MEKKYFEVRTYEVHMLPYFVEAESQKEAEGKIKDGLEEDNGVFPVNDLYAYLGQLEDFVKTDANREITKEEFDKHVNYYCDLRELT